MALRTPQRPWMPPHGAQRASWRASGALQMDLAGPERQGRCQEGPARLSQRRSWHPLSARTDHPAHRRHCGHRLPQEAQAAHAPARGLALCWFQALDRASGPQADTKPGWQDQTQHLTSPYAQLPYPHKRLCPFSANTRFAPSARHQARERFYRPDPPRPPP